KGRICLSRARSSQRASASRNARSEALRPRISISLTPVIEEVRLPHALLVGVPLAFSRIALFSSRIFFYDALLKTPFPFARRKSLHVRQPSAVAPRLLYELSRQRRSAERGQATPR